MKKASTVLIPLLLPLAAMASELPFMEDSAGPKDQAAFAALLARDWSVAFSDDGTGDWQKQWTLDGKHATLTNTPAGMEFRAGPTVDPAHHAVLWTKPSFAGDLKIEYEYTRLDEAKEFVTILYIQATGDGNQGRKPDISTWADQRTKPDMWRYYNGMHLYHISMAAFDAERGTPEYIRARRYMPSPKKKEHRWPHGTALKPDYLDTGLWQTGQPHQITVVKQDRDLWMQIISGKKRLLCHWHNDRLPPILAGRIGLRHMHTRQARYRNMKVFVPGQQAADSSKAAVQTVAVVDDVKASSGYSTLIEDPQAPVDQAVPVTNRASFPPYYNWLNLQHGMHFKGTTYFCFHGDGEDKDDPLVMAYDHAEKSLTGPVKAGETLLPDSDNHGNPGLIVDDLGHVHVIYGGHGKQVQGKDGKSKISKKGGGMRHMRTVKPGDISAWERLDNIPTDATYPKLFKMSDGTIYYTHRDGTHATGHVIHQSTDHGVTFPSRVAFLGGGRKNGGKKHRDGKYAQELYRDAWYTHARQGTGDSIHFMFYYHACSLLTPKDATHNEHGERRLNLYYLKYEHETQSWHTVTGMDITDRLPLSRDAAYELCLVYESKVKAQPGKVDAVAITAMGITPKDRPILSYRSSGGLLIKDSNVSRLAFGHVDGWKHLATAKAPMKLITGIPDDIVSFQEFSLYSRSGIIRTTDGGKTFKRIRRFEAGDHPSVASFSYIYQPHPEARYIAAAPGHKWGSEDDGVEMYLWGNGGFITPQAEEK